MKVRLLPLSYLPWYILVVSLFMGGLVAQYVIFAAFILSFLLSERPTIQVNKLFNVTGCFIGIAGISYWYNLFLGDADFYTIIFWIFSYFPPIFLLWILPSFLRGIEFNRIYGFYKKLVYLQSFLLILSAIRHQKFIVGDPATGTIGDANWVAFHICVVLIYEISKLITRWKNDPSFKANYTGFLEIFYFLIVFLIPESTANLGFFMLIVGFMFLKEFIFSGINVTRIILFFSAIFIGFYLVSKTPVYDRISSAIGELQSSDMEKNPYLAKVKIYKKLIDGDIYGNSNSNWLIGSGPATFTSRSSVMRMPDERFNEFPLELPYYKSTLFKKYISPIYAEWRASKESYGNFASPQTTIVSVAVELGIMGLLFFALLFYQIFKINSIRYVTTTEQHNKKFIFYFSVFFIINLFHLNFWEYPIISFTYIIFVCLVLFSKNETSQHLSEIL